MLNGHGGTQHRIARALANSGDTLSLPVLYHATMVFKPWKKAFGVKPTLLEESPSASTQVPFGRFWQI